MTDILDLPGWVPTSTRADGGELVIEADYTVPPSACQKCGVIGALYKHGPKPINIRDSPIRGAPVRIQANAQRYKCRDCGGTFIQPLGGVREGMRMTARCVQYIEEQSLRDTFVRIAEHVGCDDKTVRTIAGDYIDRLNAQYKPWLPDWLGIDETQIDGVQRCVITDVGRRKPVDMLADREKPTVTQWLYQFRDRQNVKGLAIDMWKPYRDAARAVFPGLPVVVDKFHLVKMANKALEDIRVELAKKQPREVGRDWMRRKSLLRMRYRDLDEKGRFALQMWLDNEPDIGEAYRLKEAFYGIYDAESHDDGAARLDAWRASIPAKFKVKKGFAPLMTATRNWREEMLAVFEYPITNGYTEALNGVAKVINRSGRGYSFEVLRARLLFSKGIPTPAALPAGFQRVYPTSAAEKGHHMLVDALGNRCESCLGIYDQLEAHRIPPLASEKRGRVLYMCSDCYTRFHTEALTHGSQPSTP